MISAFFRSIAAYVVTSLYVLVTGPVGMLWAIISHNGRLLFIFGHGGVRTALWLTGIKYTIFNRERIPLDRAVIFCANHQSNLDPPVLFGALHYRLNFLYKAELNRIPILARGFRMGGFVPAERGTKQARLAADIVAERVKAGYSFLIFPEGTRSRTESLLPFKGGAFAIAIKAQAPIVPVAITGGRQAMKTGSWLVYPARITIRIGQPIETIGLDHEQRGELSDRVRAEIERLLAIESF